MFILHLAMIVAFFAMLGVVSMTVSRSASGFMTSQSTVQVSDGGGHVSSPVTVPAAQAATLTTRTNGTSGSLTMTSSSHGITTGQRVDLYWTGGHCYGAVVGTVSGTTVPISSVAGGDALPSASTAILVGICTSVAFPCTGNNMQVLVMDTPQSGYFVFNDGSANNYAAFVTGGQGAMWVTGDAGANPLAGAAVTTLYVSHNGTSAVTAMRAGYIGH